LRHGKIIVHEARSNVIVISVVDVRKETPPVNPVSFTH